MISIPAYNEYRKSAKKTAYRSDLLSLHKGWLAFGVELDSFCERETSPTAASLVHVGMQSLITSKLYGDNGVALVECTGSCTAGTPANSVGPGIHPTGSTCATGCTATAPTHTGPDKNNFIGFSTENCTSVNGVTSLRLNDTEEDTSCDLNVTTYDLGVFGHIAGTEYVGFEVNEDGVVAEKSGLTSSIANGAVCTT